MEYEECPDCGELVCPDCGECEECGWEPEEPSSTIPSYDDIADIIPQSEEEVVGIASFLGYATCNLFASYLRDTSVWFLSLGSLFAQQGRAKRRKHIAKKLEADLRLFEKIGE